jgi:DNA-binding transcriptional LysR family regulator
MDYRDFVFLTAATNLSFSKAANELFISQPAVTKHIKELESKLNITLFERKGNKIYLTEAGELTYRFLKKIEQQYNEMEFEIGRLNNMFKGSLKIGASSTIAQYVIPSTLAEFNKKYPKIELFLYNGNSTEIEEKLLKNDIDLALVENHSSHSNIKYTDFLNDEIIVISSKNSIYAKNNILTISDFKEIPIVLREAGSGTLEVIKKFLIDKYNISIEDLNVKIHLGSTEAIKNFLYKFEGLAIVSKKSVEKEIQMKFFKKIQIKNMIINRNFRIATRQGSLSSTSELFINFMNHYNF